MSTETKKGLDHSKAFKQRRFLNWFPLGLMYASFYMGRYNLSVANPHMREQYGWGKEDFGWIVTIGLAVYGIAVFFNGPLADRIGGRKAILIGAIGAIIANIIFGIGIWTPYIAFFTLAYALNMFFQTYGALSVVKVNAAWFNIKERGTFAGIFGGMIQFGRILAYGVGGFIVARMHWEWAFWVPAIVLMVVFVFNYIFVRDTPEELGFKRVDDVLAGEEEGVKPTIRYLVAKIFTNPTLLIIAGAMMCTGLVRHTIEQWGPSYFVDVHQVPDDSFIYQFCFNGTVVVGIFGALFMGWISDRFFQSRRGPITAIGYFSMMILLFIFALTIKVPQPVKLVLASINNKSILQNTTMRLTGQTLSGERAVLALDKECQLSLNQNPRIKLDPQVCSRLLKYALKPKYWDPKKYVPLDTSIKKEAAGVKGNYGLEFQNSEGNFKYEIAHTGGKDPSAALVSGILTTLSDQPGILKGIAQFDKAMKPLLTLGKNISSSANSWSAAIILIIIYFFLNGCHGLLAGTASMDFGGRKAAASAAGLLDGSQYLAGALLVGPLMGRLLDRLGWDYWAWTIIPIALIGAILMASRWKALPVKSRKAH